MPLPRASSHACFSGKKRDNLPTFTCFTKKREKERENGGLEKKKKRMRNKKKKEEEAPLG